MYAAIFIGGGCKNLKSSGAKLGFVRVCRLLLRGGSRDHQAGAGRSCRLGRYGHRDTVWTVEDNHALFGNGDTRPGLQLRLGRPIH